MRIDAAATRAKAGLWPAEARALRQSFVGGRAPNHGREPWARVVRFERSGTPGRQTQEGLRMVLSARAPAAPESKRPTCGRERPGTRNRRKSGELRVVLSVRAPTVGGIQ